MTEANESGDWRSKYSVTDRWIEARKKSLFTDVNFVVGQGERAKSFSSHKNVLAFSSPVFEAMFYGTLSEKKDPILIVDMDPEAFGILLRYAYGEKISFLSVSSAAKTYVVADKYLVSDLQSLAEDHISKATMDDPQFWDVIHPDKFFHIPVVKKKCLDYIAVNAAVLFKSCLFTKVSYAILEAIVQMDKIKISEFELLSIVVRWGISNIQSEKRLRTRLEPLLGYIRFANLTLDEFCSFLDIHPGLLDADDNLSIMKHLHKKSAYKLPVWCSTSSKQRCDETHPSYYSYNEEIILL